MVRMRWDLAICFFLTMMLFAGLVEVDERTGFFSNAFEKVWDCLGDAGIADALDDEMGDSQTISQNGAMILGIMSIIFPVLALAVLLGIIFGLHAIGGKIGIFPPVFSKKKKSQEKE